ncbi:unnamed protein product [Ophioblennius macclurei]
MALKATLAWLCSVAVLHWCAAQDGASAPKCSSRSELLENLKGAVECVDNVPADGGAQQTAALMLYLKHLTGALLGEQLRDCHGAAPSQCPNADVPENGGLACVTVANKRYCKPLCNHGFDFGFLRRSRPYDECSEATGYRWNTQYVGGNQLAVCQEAAVAVSGVSSAYFPRGQECLAAKADDQLTDGVARAFVAELKSQEIEAEPQDVCLVCG